MKTKLIFSLFLLFVFAFAVNSIFAQNEYLKIDFPEVEGWKKGAVTRYPAAALGYSVNYESKEGGRVTVYVYNGGRSKITSGAKDKVVKDEIEKAKNEIYQVEKMGVYKNVKEHKNETISLGGEKGKVECLHTLFSFTAGENNLSSDIYLFGYKDHFIKLRATRLLEKEDVKNQSLTTLFTALDKLFSADETIALFKE
jgi:hypothetical protein